MLIVLWAAVAFMLAVGCANVANLLLAHAAGRQREVCPAPFAGRASNARLVRQLLTESIALAGLGGFLGLTMACASGRCPRWRPSCRWRSRTIRDVRRLWTLPSRYGLLSAISMLTGVAFESTAAVGSARQSLSRSLRGRQCHGRGQAALPIAGLGGLWWWERSPWSSCS